MYAWPGYDGISPFLAQFHLGAMHVDHVYDGLGKVHNADSLAGSSSSGSEFSVELPTEEVSLYDAPQILLDFGREVTGRIELQSDSSQPSDVTVQYGESEMEALRDPYLGIDPIHVPPHATAYGPKSAFRYVLVRFTGGRDTRYKSIQLDGIAYPVTYTGSFSSSDPGLNQMWAIGAYTAHLCMQDDIWDAPKRDRGRWLGDLDVSGRTIEDVFGDGFLMDDIQAGMQRVCMREKGLWGQRSAEKTQIHARILRVVLPFGQSANPFGQEAEVNHAAHFQTAFFEGRHSRRRDCGFARLAAFCRARHGHRLGDAG
jgi:hypothetical protein